jgi:hypothetical protein
MSQVLCALSEKLENNIIAISYPVCDKQILKIINYLNLKRKLLPVNKRWRRPMGKIPGVGGLPHDPLP